MIAGLPIDRGPLDGEWVTLAALAGERFDLAEAYFTAAERGDPGLDRRGQGAYFLGTISYYLAAAIADAVLRRNEAPDVSDATFGVTPGGETAMSLHYRLAAEIGVTDRPIGAVMEAAMAPLVARVKAETRLSDPAQWRLVADSIAGAFLLVGDALGRGAEAQAIALVVVRDPRFKPFNGHTGYHQLSETQMFLRRGGCCRYYTCDAGSYCATCILRPPEEQLRELRERYGTAS
jgi:hypothetical protein